MMHDTERHASGQLDHAGDAGRADHADHAARAPGHGAAGLATEAGAPAELPPSLVSELERLATAPVLLVASDYDGTLSPIVHDPAAARPIREAVAALQALAQLPHTHVAVISGRALADLDRMTGLVPPVHLVGSHGSEFDAGFAGALPAADTERLQRVRAALEAIAADHPGVRLEPKPASVAFHYRGVDPAVAEAAVAAARRGPGAEPGVTVRDGKQVVEFLVVDTHKGDALARLRQRLQTDAVLFLGDDVTDEDAFRALGGQDVGVKVGDGATAAGHRVADPMVVARALAWLEERRSTWLTDERATPIEDHAVLSDLRTAALVTPDAAITWFCPGRLDGPALFASLLDGPSAGHFTVADAGGAAARGQRWIDGGLVLETDFGGWRVRDTLDVSGSRFRQRAGRNELLRVLDGHGEVTITFAPRPDFGRMYPSLALRDDGVVVEDVPEPIVLRAPGVAWRIETSGGQPVAVGTVALTGTPVTLELRCGTASLRAGGDPLERLGASAQWWRSWADHLAIPGVASDLVRHSALMIRALCHGPSGAIAAAATTSLPETVGGVRNWDYRYCWPRDAALAASALVELGSTAEALALLDWIVEVVHAQGNAERLKPLYTVTGGDPSPEAEIGALGGWRGSRPVRIGNAAAHQVQLDVFGPIADLICQLAEAHAPLTPDHWRLAEDMTTAVARRWHEPDHGIWEIRKPRRHHVHSRAMCWTTVDRGIRVARIVHDQARPDWERLRDAIRDDVLEHGWRPEVGAFTAAYDGDDLDAAALHVGLSGMLAADDPRFVGTVEAVERDLKAGPTVYRYVADDGLPGREGGFVICATWLVEALLLIGRRDDARALFDGIVATAGPTGSLPEQWDPEAGIALGNTPQAYSHLGVIRTARRLAGEG